MDRTQRMSNDLDVDMLKPFNREELMQNIDENDCFGKLWVPTEKECAYCAVAEICGTLCKGNRAGKRKMYEDKDGPFLDQVVKLTEKQLDAVADIIVNTHFEGTPTTTDEMFTYFKKKMKTKDDKLVVIELRKFITSREDIYTKGGMFYSKSVDEAEMNGTRP